MWLEWSMYMADDVRWYVLKGISVCVAGEEYVHDG